jgi:hypothetical protein
MARVSKKGKGTEKTGGENGPPPVALDSPLHSGVHSERRFLAYPFFDLTRIPRRHRIDYRETLGGEHVEVEVTSAKGIATIYDRDLLVYVGSLLRQRIQDNPELSRNPKNADHRTFHFSLHDFCEATSRSRGDGYERIDQVVERLRATLIRTTIRAGGERTRGWFSWLTDGTYVRTRDDDEDREGNAHVCAVLCEWLFKAILRDGDLLAIPPNYFQLAPIERRLYDLAHVQCDGGDQWMTTIGLLQAKTGSDMLARHFKTYLSNVGATGLPDYEIVLLDEYEQPEKRGRGRPSAALQKVIIRPKDTPFVLGDKVSRRGKSAALKPARQPRKRKLPPLLDYLECKSGEDAQP